MGDAAQHGLGVGQRRDCRDHRGSARRLRARSASMPVDPAGAGEGQARRRSARRNRPCRVKSPAQRVTGLGGALGPVGDGHPAAGDQGGGQERLPRWTDRARRPGPGRAARSASTRHTPCSPPCLGGVDLARPPRAACRPSSGCAAGRAARGPMWRTSTPWLKRGADSSSALTNWEDAEASIRDRAAVQRPAAVHGHRQRAAAVVVDAGAEHAQRVDHAVQRALVRARVAVEADRSRRRARRPAAGSASRCRRCRRRWWPGRAARRG
jgi:hypothetical protein